MLFKVLLLRLCYNCSISPLSSFQILPYIPLSSPSDPWPLFSLVIIACIYTFISLNITCSLDVLILDSLSNKSHVRIVYIGSQMFLFFFLVVVLVEAFTHHNFFFSIIDTISLCQIMWSPNSCFKLVN